MSRSYGEGEWIATFDGDTIAVGSQEHCFAAIGREVMALREAGYEEFSLTPFTLEKVVK